MDESWNFTAENVINKLNPFQVLRIKCILRKIKASLSISSAGTCSGLTVLEQSGGPTWMAATK